MALSRKDEIRRETSNAFEHIRKPVEERQVLIRGEKRDITVFYNDKLKQLENWGS
jgi:hypothetical protein